MKMKNSDLQLTCEVRFRGSETNENLEKHMNIFHYVKTCFF